MGTGRKTASALNGGLDGVKDLVLIFAHHHENGAVFQGLQPGVASAISLLPGI